MNALFGSVFFFFFLSVVACALLPRVRQVAVLYYVMTSSVQRICTGGGSGFSLLTLYKSIKELI